MVTQQAGKTAAVVAFLLVVLLFVIDALFGERTPVHLHLVSTSTGAALTVDGATHTFAWPVPPTRLAILPNDPNVHEWGIDGSQSQTASIANVDPTYLGRIRTNPYVALDRWLRGEDGYDEWRNVRVTASAPGLDVPPDTPHDPARSFALPRAFIFDADLYRIERPATVQLTARSGTYQLTLDRLNRAITISSTPTGGAAGTLAQWYFPTDPRPFLALDVTTLSYSVAWAALLVGLAVLVAAALPARMVGRLTVSRVWSGLSAVALPILALLASLALTLYIALVEYNGMPHIFDAQSYLFQSKILAMGRLTVAPPPLADAFPVPFFGVVRGQWVGQYAPGTALTLVPGVLLGMPWLVQPLLGIGILALVFAIGRRLYGIHVAVLALVLGVLSPFHNFMIGTYLSHVPAAFFITLAYYLLVRSDWGRSTRLAMAAGAALGMAFLCRELSSSLAFLALLAWLGGQAWKHRVERPWWPSLLAFILAYGLFLALDGLYNWSITGNPFVSPRNIVDPSDRYGFGTGLGFWGRHTLASALLNTDQLLTGLILDLDGWPYYMALAVPLIPFVLARANRWDALNAAIVLSIVVGSMGYFYNGVAIGPRYYYEAVPSLLLLTARGVQVLGNVAGELLSFLRRSQVTGPLAAHLLLVALILPDLFFYLPRHLELYRNFTAIAWMAHPPMARIYADAPRHAIVVTSDFYVFSDIMAALNNPAALVAPARTRDDVWALASTPARYAQLSAAFPHRHLYILAIDGTTVDFQPWSPTQARRA